MFVLNGHRIVHDAQFVNCSFFLLLFLVFLFMKVSGDLMPKKENLKKEKEFLLVYVDGSDEFLEAMIYACNVAKNENLGIILLYIIEGESFRHWKGVESIMRAEKKQAKPLQNSRDHVSRTN